MIANMALQMCDDLEQDIAQFRRQRRAQMNRAPNGKHNARGGGERLGDGGNF
jgi:hypothetical protein